MQHSPSKTKVYQTTEYKSFSHMAGNRPLNNKKIERIIREIETGNDILDEVPILVIEKGSKLEVMEGQHRLEVARRLKRPVHYIIHKAKATLYNVAKINSNTEKWKAADFINCYATDGNDHYIKFKKFQEKYRLPISTCLVLLTSGAMKSEGNSQSLRQAFEQGTFEVKKHKEAVLLAELCKTFDQFSGWNTGGFVVAITKLQQAEKCDFDILLKKFLKDPTRLTHQPSWKAYVNQLESIYNAGNSIRRVIY